MADNNNNQNSSSKGKEKEDAGVSFGAQSGQRHQMRRGGFQSSQSSSCRPTYGSSSSSAPATMFQGSTCLPKGDLKLETTENFFGVSGFGFVDKQGNKPKSVVGALDIPGCAMAIGGVDNSTKALLESWRILQEARPGKQMSWMLFVDDGPEVVKNTPHGSKRGRDVLAGTDDFEARSAKAPKLPAPKQPAAPGKARDSQPDGQSLPRPPKEKKCVGCGSEDHVLRRCLKAGEDGIVKGCPKCNSLTHSVFGRTVMEDREKFLLSVVGRRGMPPLLDLKSWAELASKNSSKASAIRGFPWSEEFTKSLAEEIPRLQEALDKYGFQSPGVFTLPQDPLTKDWAAVEKSVSLRPLRISGTATPEQREAALAQVAEIFKKIEENKPDAEMADTPGPPASGPPASGKGKEKSAPGIGDVDQTEVKEEPNESSASIVLANLANVANDEDALVDSVVAGLSCVPHTKETKSDGTKVWVLGEESGLQKPTGALKDLLSKFKRKK
ncbi:Ff.00g107340.m01.CDS01 [Fusarium sp. VM40]|nr:Ff.00g107340.m01.CDS01 [Fusarium sp. VM40]